MNNNSILIIDDEVQIRRLLSITLEMSKYKVLVASNAKEGLMAAAMHSPTLIILDLGLPDEDRQSVISPHPVGNTFYSGRKRPIGNSLIRRFNHRYAKPLRKKEKRNYKIDKY